MMRTRFDGQLEELKGKLVEMGNLCEDAIGYAIKAMMEDSSQMREKTYEADKLIDDMEREIERDCLRLLLQQQPVARDLRLISSALKMISDMERIGDQAYDIAEITEFIKQEGRDMCGGHINRMAETAVEMVKKSVEAFVSKDLEIARQVYEMDDIVDGLFEDVKMELIEAIATDKTKGEYLVDNLMIAKYLERIGDHAVNIGGWVQFSITGVHGEKNEKRP